MEKDEHVRAELKLFVPTYNYSVYPDEVVSGVMEDYTESRTPVLIREEAGVRIILGTHDSSDRDKPDVLIERQANGWLIFLHPEGGDPSGYVYFLDNGESYAMKELGLGAIEFLEADEEWPFLTKPMMEEYETNELGSLEDDDDDEEDGDADEVTLIPQ